MTKAVLIGDKKAKGFIPLDQSGEEVKSEWQKEFRISLRAAQLGKLTLVPESQ